MRTTAVILVAMLLGACAHDAASPAPLEAPCPYASAKDGTQSDELLCQDPIASRVKVKHILIAWREVGGGGGGAGGGRGGGGEGGVGPPGSPGWESPPGGGAARPPAAPPVHHPPPRPPRPRGFRADPPPRGRPAVDEAAVHLHQRGA